MRKFLILLPLVLIIYNAFAQKSSIGIKAGGNITSFYNSGLPDIAFKSGFLIGTVGELGISKRFFIQPELYYEKRGARQTLNGIKAALQDHPYVDQESTIRFNYLEFSALAKYYLNNKKILYLFAGPQAGLLLAVVENIKLKDHTSGELISDGNNDFKELDTFDQFNKVDAGIIAGSGVSFRINSMIRLFVDARYNMSFVSVYKENKIYPKHYGFSLNSGVMFELF